MPAPKGKLYDQERSELGADPPADDYGDEFRWEIWTGAFAGSLLLAFLWLSALAGSALCEGDCDRLSDVESQNATFLGFDSLGLTVALILVALTKTREFVKGLAMAVALDAAVFLVFATVT